MTKLGKNQREVLNCLVEHGNWPGGWQWQNHSTTIKILDSLVKRGLAEQAPDRGLYTIGVYTATNDGVLEAKGALDWKQRERKARKAFREESERQLKIDRLKRWTDTNVVTFTDDELYALNMAVIYIADGEDNEAQLKRDLYAVNTKLMEADEKMQERQRALAAS